VRPAARLAAAALLLYALAMAGTNWVFAGDAPDYARHVAAARVSGDLRGLMEFGHPLWRPLGWAYAAIADDPGTGARRLEPWLRILAFLNGAALVLGGAAAVFAALWLRSRFDGASAAFGLLWLLGARAFLNYAHVGTSYVPGLAFLLGGLFVASLGPASRGGRAARDVGAGVLYGASILCWAPYALVLPGAVAAPFLLGPDARREVGRVVLTGLAGLATLALAYGVVGVALGFAEVTDPWSWAARASGGRGYGGAGRVLVGIPRSLVDLGDLGRTAKRFLLRDPLCPATARDLLGLDLAKMLVVYAGLAAATLAAAASRRGRRVLLVAATMAVPLLAFAVLWQGGDLERYLPAVPALLAVQAAGFREARGRPLLRGVMGAALGTTILANVHALSNGAVRARQDAALSRLPPAAGRGEPRTAYVVPHAQDDLFLFYRTYPLHPRNLGGLRVEAVFAPGMPSSATWRERFDVLVAAEKASGGRVRVSSRLLAPRPSPEWDWIEGDDTRVTWRDLHEHFARLVYAAPERRGEEFLILERGTPATRDGPPSVPGRP
jgi:hypothetical protein